MFRVFKEKSDIFWCQHAVRCMPVEIVASYFVTYAFGLISARAPLQPERLLYTGIVFQVTAQGTTAVRTTVILLLLLLPYVYTLKVYFFHPAVLPKPSSSSISPQYSMSMFVALRGAVARPIPSVQTCSRPVLCWAARWKGSAAPAEKKDEKKNTADQAATAKPAAAPADKATPASESSKPLPVTFEVKYLCRGINKGQRESSLAIPSVVLAACSCAHLLSQRLRYTTTAVTIRSVPVESIRFMRVDIQR